LAVTQLPTDNKWATTAVNLAAETGNPMSRREPGKLFNLKLASRFSDGPHYACAAYLLSAVYAK